MFTYFIFSDQADDSEKKCKDLEKSVCDYQSLLKEASHRYGALEDQCDRDRAGMLQLQWGSELVWYSNGPVFEFHLNTGEMDVILFSYVLVQFLHCWSSTKDISHEYQTI